MRSGARAAAAIEAGKARAPCPLFSFRYDAKDAGVFRILHKHRFIARRARVSAFLWTGVRLPPKVGTFQPQEFPIRVGDQPRQRKLADVAGGGRLENQLDTVSDGPLRL
jgi:hypothetical protein